RLPQTRADGQRQRTGPQQQLRDTLRRTAGGLPELAGGEPERPRGRAAQGRLPVRLPGGTPPAPDRPPGRPPRPPRPPVVCPSAATPPPPPPPPPDASTSSSPSSPPSMRRLSSATVAARSALSRSRGPIVRTSRAACRRMPSLWESSSPPSLSAALPPSA